MNCYVWFFEKCYRNMEGFGFVGSIGFECNVGDVFGWFEGIKEEKDLVFVEWVECGYVCWRLFGVVNIGSCWMVSKMVWSIWEMSCCVNILFVVIIFYDIDF